MAEGWQRRTPEGPAAGASPWWSDGYHDPWRDPRAAAVVVVPPGAPPPGGLEPVPDPDGGPRRGLGLVFLISLVTALLAGALGGSLGYALGVRGGAGGPLGGPPVAAPSAAQRPPDSLAGVARRVLPSLVTVRVSGAATASLGSGFVVTADGHVVTNDHVVGAARSVTLAFADGTTTTASVTGRDPESDLAVLRIAGARNLTPVEFGDSDAVAVGDPVLAFGAPLALANTVTAGIVSALDRPVQAGGGGSGPVRYYAAIQTDAAINQGNSGGPLVDGDGRVIGVNSSIRSLAESEDTAGNIGLAFAIPINQAKRVTQEIIATGRARRT
ncbi:MAG TPA: trypsin-like peptidase domain-containing protein, partial [Pilimelia sp.]|nr:trypsin-like peptidase domain-containing protein [Pilimelia sp.]